MVIMNDHESTSNASWPVGHDLSCQFPVFFVTLNVE
jgi:hypothetical protein